MEDVSDIFYFFLLGEGEGGVRGAGRGGGVGFLLRVPGGGAFQGEGAKGPGGCLRRIGELGGGGLNIFFGGRNVLQAMNGGSSAPYLAWTPCVPLFCALFKREGLLDYQGPTMWDTTSKPKRSEMKCYPQPSQILKNLKRL